MSDIRFGDRLAHRQRGTEWYVVGIDNGSIDIVPVVADLRKPLVVSADYLDLNFRLVNRFEQNA